MFAIRYVPDTDLGRRFAGTSAPFETREDAERLRLQCANAASMEVVEVES
jgi:hypothetical protein